MEMRKSKKIIQTGQTDDYILSKKNKNLNNMKLFENQKKPEARVSTPIDKNQAFAPTVSLMEKIEEMTAKN